MKLTNFKIYTLMIASFALFAFSGCDGTTGISSDSGIAVVAPVPDAPVPDAPVPDAPVPDAGTSTVTANLGSVLADGTSTSTVTVTIKDAASNPITDAAVSLAQTGSSTIDAVTNNGDGTYMFDVTSTTVETVTYTATADTVAITQTVNVDFTAVPPPVPDAGTSTVTANLASVPADGTTTSTVTVTVKDELSNPITNAAVSLDQGAGSSTISSPVDTSNAGAGIYTFDVNSTTVETVTYTATADTVVITQTVDVTFTETEAQCLLAAGYGTVDINSRTWLDKNLGAINPATGPTDADAYGDYYQWGRSADGHQVVTSDVNDTLATNLNSSDTTTDWYGKFIKSPSIPYDWTTADSSGNTRSTSWSTPYDATTNPNQVCPCGYVVPTLQDFVDLNKTSEPDNATKFNSAWAGWRKYQDGVLAVGGDVYWTSDLDPSSLGGSGSISYYFNEDTTNTPNRAYGLSIRCIKP